MSNSGSVVFWKEHLFANAVFYDATTPSAGSRPSVFGGESGWGSERGVTSQNFTPQRWEDRRDEF